MESGKIKRTTNRRQFKEIVEQMKVQPDIARSTNKLPSEYVQEFWENLTESLNSLGPPYKEISEWKKVWSDFKSSIKKKLANNKKAANGEYEEEQFFTTLEEEVIQLVFLQDCVEGVPQTRAFGMPSKRKLDISSTVDVYPTVVSPSVSVEEKPFCGDILPNDLDALDEYYAIQEDEHNRKKKRSTGKTPSHTQLLEDQIGLQKKLYDKVTLVLNKNVDQAQNLNTNIEKIVCSLNRLDEHEAKQNDILQAFLQETKRHNRRMEQLLIDKEAYLSDSTSE